MVTKEDARNDDLEVAELDPTEFEEVGLQSWAEEMTSRLGEGRTRLREFLSNRRDQLDELESLLREQLQDAQSRAQQRLSEAETRESNAECRAADARKEQQRLAEFLERLEAIQRDELEVRCSALGTLNLRDLP